MLWRMWRQTLLPCSRAEACPVPHKTQGSEISKTSAQERGQQRPSRVMGEWPAQPLQGAKSGELSLEDECSLFLCCSLLSCPQWKFCMFFPAVSLHRKSAPCTLPMVLHHHLKNHHPILAFVFSVSKERTELSASYSQAYCVS